MQTAPLLDLELPGIRKIKSGKVREIFDLGDRLLFVASDRISAFDCIMPNGIPRKGEVHGAKNWRYPRLLNALADPHSREGASIDALFGMSDEAFRGKPVIGPCAPGVLEYFADDSLVFFELGDAADLARQIEFVIRHPLEVGEITRRGQEVCLAHPWSHERETLVGVTLKLLAGNRPAETFGARYPEVQAE